MLRIGEIYGELTLRAKQYQKELGNQERLTKKFAKGIRNVFLGVTAAFAGITYAVARITKSLITAYSQQEVAERKLEAALLATKGAAGLTIDELKEMAMELRNLTAIDDDVIIGAQGIMLTFTKISRDVFPAAIEAAMNMSVMFGQDLQQSVIQLGTALNDPIRGVGRLRRIGISFTDEQKKMIDGFVKANDIIGAQTVILDELEVEIGGVARSIATTTEGAIKQFRNALEDIREELGERIAPFISTYAILMSKSFKIMKEHLDILLPGFEELSESSEKATRLGLAFSVTTTRGIFKMRAGVIRLKIVFWGLIMALSRVMQEMYGMLKWGTLIWRKYGEGIAKIIDTLFKTKLGDAIRGMGDFFAESGEQWKMYTDEAKEQMWILYEELVKVNDREKYSIDELIEAYDKLIAKKLAAIGVIPGGDGGDGGDGDGEAAKRTMWWKPPVEGMKKMVAETGKAKKAVVDLSQAGAQFGAVMGRALTDSTFHAQDLIVALTKIILQMALIGIPGIGPFLSAFVGAGMEKGGFITPPFAAQYGLMLTRREGYSPYGAPVGEKGKMEVIAPFDKFVDVVDKLTPQIHIHEPGPFTRTEMYRDFSQEELDIIERELFERVMERLEERE